VLAYESYLPRISLDSRGVAVYFCLWLKQNMIEVEFKLIRLTERFCVCVSNSHEFADFCWICLLF